MNGNGKCKLGILNNHFVNELLLMIRSSKISQLFKHHQLLQLSTFYFRCSHMLLKKPMPKTLQNNWNCATHLLFLFYRLLLFADVRNQTKVLTDMFML